MSLHTIRAKVRRLELARHAADHAKPTPEEMRAAALSGQGRPVVLDMLARMRAYATEIEDSTRGFCPLPRTCQA